MSRSAVELAGVWLPYISNKIVGWMCELHIVLISVRYATGTAPGGFLVYGRHAVLHAAEHLMRVDVVAWKVQLAFTLNACTSNIHVNSRKHCPAVNVCCYWQPCAIDSLAFAAALLYRR